MDVVNKKSDATLRKTNTEIKFNLNLLNYSHDYIFLFILLYLLVISVIPFRWNSGLILERKKKTSPYSFICCIQRSNTKLEIQFDRIHVYNRFCEDFARKNSLRVCETKLVKKQWARRIRCFQEAARGEAKLFRSSCKRGSAHRDNFLNALDHSTYPR